MSVSGIGRMGYNDEYLAGQRGDEFIIYKFGSDSIRVYNNEFEMQQDLHELGQNIDLKMNRHMKIIRFTCLKSLFKYVSLYI